MKLSRALPDWINPLLTVVFLASVAPVAAVPGDEHWSSEFGFPGVPDSVWAITLHKDRVYAGGESTSGGTNFALHCWDGNQWSVLGEFLGTYPTLYDLVFVGETLYAAGSFTNVNGMGITGLARWTGAEWSGVGFNGTAYALAVSGNDLYVGGSFANVGGAATTNIARWDGATWHSMEEGLGLPGDVVLSLLASNGVVYAGGGFTSSGSLTVSNLARWNGSGWTDVGTGVDGRVYGLAMQGSDLYACGLFANAGGVPADGIARWDGSSWHPCDSGVPGFPLSVATWSNLVCVGGNFSSAGGVPAAKFAVWNGTTWSAAGDPSDVVLRVTSSDAGVYAGGYFITAGGGIMNRIGVWNGDQWSAVGAPNRIGGVSSIVRALAGDDTNLVAGGYFGYAGQTTATRIGRYDGTNWHAFGTGLNNTVRAVALVGTNVYAGGDFTGGSGGPLAYHVGHWNGQQWVSVGNNAFSKVSSLAAQGNDLLIAGYSPLLARWDGTNQSDVLAFDSEHTFFSYIINDVGVSAIAVQETNIYLSGSFFIFEHDGMFNGTNCDHAMLFDGTYGHIMGRGLDTNANAIAVVGTDVYYGGPITLAGDDVSVSGIARWDGSSWSDVGGGIVGPGTINALAVIGTNLYAGGSFTNIGGVDARHIARWDGQSWSALGSGTLYSPTGTAGPVLALTAMGNDLYVGGTFRFAGGKAAEFLARWNETMGFDLPSLRLSDYSGAPDEPFRFTLTSFGVPVYVVEGFDGSGDWSPLATNSVTPLDFIDTEATGLPQRLYQARSLP